MGNGDIKKLGTLLDYWIEHNKEHGQEFKEWAEKMRSMGEAEIDTEMLKAAGEMDKVTRYLQRAREVLTEKEK